MKKIWVVIIGVILAASAMVCVSCGKKPATATTYEYALSDTAVALGVGQTKQLSVTATPEKEVSPTYASDNASVASVSGGGLITANAAGSATITAAVDGKELTCTVTVTEYTLNFIELELEQGQTKQLAVTSSSGKALTVTYATRDAAIATVSESGLVTAVGVGKTDVTATVDGVPLICSVTVKQLYEYALSVNTLDMAAGTEAVITLTVTPEKPDLSFTFVSDTPSVATVGAGTGVVTALAAGKAKIVCTADGRELTCEVSVTKYTLSETEITITEGKSAQLTVKAEPQGDFTAVFASKNEAVARVSEAGQISAVAQGKTEITATVNGAVLTCAVTVAPSYAYELSESALVMLVADTRQLSVKVTPAKPDADITYESSDEGIATVGADGTVTAVGFGNCTITATADGKRLTCEVTVTIDAALTFKAAGGAYSLTALDDVYATADWRFLGKDGYTENMAAGAGLIGEIPVSTQYFYDYQGTIGWTDGATNKVLAGRSDGRVYPNGVTFDVALTSDVRGIVLFVGAYNATNRLTATLNGHKLAEHAFTSSGASVNQVITISLDTAMLKTSRQTLTIQMEREGDDNVSLVAVAVIGSDERPAVDSADVAMTKTEMTGCAASRVDLTAVGTEDWYYLNFENDDGDRKKDGAAILTDSLLIEGKGAFWDYKAAFSWTDGTKWESNPLDKGEDSNSWVDCEDNRATNNGYCGSSAAISVNLTAGKHTVYLYVSGYQSTYGVSVIDPAGNTLFSEQMAENNGGTQAFEVKFELDVRTAGEYVFGTALLVSSGNVGLAAVAVA